MWESKPPPLLFILLWQHFCYYKRHKVLLAFSILLPFALLGFVVVFTWLLTSGALSYPEEYPVTRHQTASLLSSGILQYVEGTYSCYQESYTPQYFNDYTISQGATYSRYNFDRSVLNYELLNSSQCQNSLLHFPQNDSICTSFIMSTNNDNKYDPTKLLIAGYIVYYPNTSVQAERVMNLVKAQLQTYTSFINAIPSAAVADSNDPRWSSLNYFINLTEACWMDVTTRVLGFANKNDLLYFTQNNLTVSNKFTNNHDPTPLLWGAINFEQTDDAFINSNQFVYSMLYEPGYSFVDEKDIWIQDLIEGAAIKLITNQSSLPITPTIKELPSKCWIKPNPSLFGIMQYSLPLAITIGFFLMPTTFLILIVQEKMLKLREYLYIMGVTDFFLKLSWIVFFLLFLIPMSILTCVIVYYMPSGLFIHSDISVLFVILVLYMLSQLCWVYLLSTVMQTPSRAGFIVGFFNIFFSAFSYSAYIFGHGELTGSFMVIARLLSLHTAVPFSLAICYFIGWEAIWTTAEWNYFFLAPTVGDQYGGFGECILWMIGDSFLYLFLGWYFQHLFPGEYGVKYPFYFLFQPSYWFPTKYGEKWTSLQTEQSQADIEAYNREHEAGIVLDSLTKYYSKDKIGIDKLSVSFYKNEITAFLGENGAGKTTTMNILVGLINPTDGKALINGMNVSKQMSEIRKLIAFVPQYDILYPSMTVEEHIQFFGWLQGLSKTQIWDTMDSLLKSFDLLAQKKNLTTNLSGGQKRKLSILTAYIGHPQVVILDEPTSGVDPYSRKAIWDIVSEHRQKATTILSTHYMQEADILGDRIAIISTGKLQCVGSSMYLKTRYGQGYRLTISVDNSRAQVDYLTENFLKQRIPDAKLIQESGNDRTYSIPIEIAQSQKMVDLLCDLEQQQQKLGIVTFGVTEPSMEEVFFAATGARHKLHKESNSNHDKAGYSKIDEDAHGPSNIFTQFAVLFMKRVLLTLRNPGVIILQILLPLILVGVMLLINGGFNQAASKTTVNFYAPYKQNVFFFQNNDGGMGNEFLKIASQYGLNPETPITGSQSESLSYPPDGSYSFNGDCSCYDYCSPEQALNYDSEVIPSKDIIYPLDSSANVSAWILHANQTNHWITGGFQFFQLPANIYNFTNYVNEQYGLESDILNTTTMLNYSVIWTPPQYNLAMLNAFNNMLLRMYNASWSIILTRESANLIRESSNIYVQILSIVESTVSCYFLIMAYVFATFGIANIVQQERSLGLKRLQFISGANPIVYWLSNMAWDLIQFTFTGALTFILLGLISNPFHNDTFNDLKMVALILMPFAVGTLAFTYLMTFVLDTPQALNRTISLLGFVALIIGNSLAIFAVANDSGLADYSWMTSVSSVLCLFPYYYVSESIAYIAYAQQGSSIVSFGFNNLLEFNMLGRRIMEAWISAVVLFVLVIVVEYITYKPFRGRAKLSPFSQTFQQMADTDVRAEAQKVLSNQCAGDPLIVRQVYKVYGKQLLPAVNGVSFSIPRGQCFGLLGINGAGKSSLFRILAGFQEATMGSANIEGLDIQANWRKVGEKMGYCPQENTVFDRLTPKEHLKLVAYLRGIPSNQIEHAISEMMRKVGLDVNSKKKASQLSGGNQRKLQFAMALLDYRPLIFLDEPTTGMDPSARRLAWNSIIDAVAQGCSVVLTSHSMEECEVLCHRLVIMVLGNFSCIGSVQYLKNKFGNKYTFKVKLNPYHDIQSVIQLKEYFVQRLPTVALIEEHSTLLVFEISAENLLVSSLFQVLCSCKLRFTGLVEDFATSQVSLEHVFVNMAERQQMLQAGIPVTFNPV